MPDEGHQEAVAEAGRSVGENDPQVALAGAADVGGVADVAGMSDMVGIGDMADVGSIVPDSAPTARTKAPLGSEEIQPAAVKQSAAASGDVIPIHAPEPSTPVVQVQEERQEDPHPHQKPAGMTFGPYYLHVGSFQNHTYAVERAAMLQKTGLVAEITHVEIEGKRWWRVLVPNLTDPQEASRLGAWVRSRYGFPARVLRG